MDFSFFKLALIALIALIVLGPRRLPEVARTAGRWMAKLRHFIAGVRQDLDREMHNAEILELERLKQELDQTRQLMHSTSSDMFNKIGGLDAQVNAAAADMRAPALAAPAAADSKPNAAPAVATKKPRAKKSKRAAKPHGRRRTAKTKRR